MIKEYDIYAINLNKINRFNVDFIKTSESIYLLRIFLIYSLKNGSDFIKKIDNSYKDGIGLEQVHIDIDNKDNLVYITDTDDIYNKQASSFEIEALLEAENTIQLCKIGFFDYIVMTKQNFIHILVAWDDILNSLPLFVLVYKDDKNWYDVLPFDSQEAMEKFVAEHTK